MPFENARSTAEYGQFSLSGILTVKKRHTRGSHGAMLARIVVVLLNSVKPFASARLLASASAKECMLVRKVREYEVEDPLNRESLESNAPMTRTPPGRTTLVISIIQGLHVVGG